MAPNADMVLRGILGLFEDSHITAPNGNDVLHPGVLSTFGCLIGIKNHGTTLVTVTKCINGDGTFGGFMTSTKPLPDDFRALWCRIFYRHDRELVLVMDANLQEFIIYDLVTGHEKGVWTLFEPLPDDAYLMSVQSIGDNEAMFALNYTSNGNNHSVECLFQGVIQEVA